MDPASGYVYRGMNANPNRIIGTQPSTTGYVYGRSSNSTGSQNTVSRISQGSLSTSSGSSYPITTSTSAQPLRSSVMVRNALDGGALCSQRTEAEFKKTAEKISSLNQELGNSISENAEVMKRLRQTLAEANKKFTDFMFKLMDSVSQTEEVEQKHENSLLFYRDIHSTLIQGYEKSIKLQLESSELTFGSSIKQYKEIIDAIAYTQIKRLEVLNQQLDTIHKVEMHELECFKQTEKMTIERENAFLENVIKIRKQELEGMRAEADLRMAEESHQQEMKLKKRTADLADRVAEYQHQERTKEIDQNGEIAREQNRNQKAIEEARIEADKIARLGEAAASASRCLIM